MLDMFLLSGEAAGLPNPGREGQQTSEQPPFLLQLVWLKKKSKNLARILAWARLGALPAGGFRLVQCKYYRGEREGGREGEAKENLLCKPAGRYSGTARV